MEFEIDITSIYRFLELPGDAMLLRMLLTFGWIPIAAAFLIGMKMIWIDYIQNKWGANLKNLLLAIDVPKGNDQSLMAVENIFTYFGGAHGTLNLIEEYWEGKYQLSFSFEIVSIDGYTQFLVRTPVHWRNLVESAIYSQYPDAEITEVNDYTEGTPSKFPDPDYDIWGAEFIHTKSDMLPIKTYLEFEHQMGEPETHFKDPMASLMDLCSSLVSGEQLWFQMIVVPEGFDWMARGDREIGKILGEKTGGGKTFANKIIDIVYGIFLSISGSLFHSESEGSSDSTDDALKMMNLKPKEKKQIEAIHKKVGKLGFQVKIRFIYLARRDVMNKAKVVNGFVGYMKQFVDMDTNNLKPDMDRTATSTSYFFKEKRLNYRKNSIMAGYKSRSGTVGRKRGMMNIEELATLWHFPVEAVVKAPMIQKTPGRKGQPPSYLPSRDDEQEQGTTDDIFLDDIDELNKKVVQDDSPENLSDLGMEDDKISDEIDKKNEVPFNLPVADSKKSSLVKDLKIDEKGEVNSMGQEKGKDVPPMNLPIG